MSECLRGLVLNFGPVTRLPYAPNQMADVFVVTTGGLGTIKLASAIKTGNVIEFAFNKPAVPERAAGHQQHDLLLRPGGADGAERGQALIWASGSPSFYAVEARVPAH